MGCNKDNAILSKEIAETKFRENDIVGAKKFALQAKALFQTLEGIDQMILALDVLIRGQAKIGEGNDWYGILQVSLLAEEQAIKKQYKKLALQTHPDKNSSICAQGAFSLVSYAWSVLSDNTKRMVYNRRRHMWSSLSHQSNYNANVNSSSGSSMSSVNGLWCHNVPDTFWTYCGSCYLNFQNSREYVNRYLKCTVCQAAFVAVEVPHPSSHVYYSNGPKPMATSNNIGGTTVSGIATPGIQVEVAPGNQNHDPTVLQQRIFLKSAAYAHSTGYTVQQTHESARKKKPGEADTAANEGTNIQGNVTQAERKHAHESSSIKRATAETREHKTEKRTRVNDGKQACWQTASSCPDGDLCKPMHPPIEQHVAHKHGGLNPEPSSNEGTSEMTVPDADFYNFGDNPESSFQNDQVWALYYEEDGMPRYYALIRKVLSTRPFKIRLAYLKANDCNEFGATKWISCGYSKTYGVFRAGVSKVTEQLKAFSHKVICEKGPGGMIRIFPKKGDIWALYQNWSRDWDELTPDDTMYKYKLVEVLDNYNPTNGVSVMPIVKIPGFVSVFKPHDDATKSWRIPEEEMLRFSHQVPFHVLTGEEAPNAPRGCYELDPGSTLKDLLQVVPPS